MSSFVRHFKAIGESKLELQSRNAKFESKLVIFSLVTSKFDRWHWKTIGHLFYTTSSFVHHFIPSVKPKWSYSLETPNLGQNRRFFVPCDLDIWRMTLKNNRAPPLCYFKLCASFLSHLSIQNEVTVRKRQIWVKIGDCLSRVTLINSRALLLCYFKLCASFHSHPWIQTGVTVRKRLSWFLTSVTLTFDLWPWPFAWISRLSLVIIPENSMMIRWWEHSEK